MKWTPVIGLVAALGIAAAGIAAAQTEPTGITKTRQDGMKSNGKSVKAIKDELDKPAPSLAVIKESVATLKDVAPKIVTWFPAGTGSESGMKTKALPAIWQKPDDFTKAHQAYSDELAKFAGLTDAGDVAAIKAEFPSLGKGCGGCHGTFRQKDN